MCSLPLADPAGLRCKLARSCDNPVLNCVVAGLVAAFEIDADGVVGLRVLGSSFCSSASSNSADRVTLDKSDLAGDALKELFGETPFPLDSAMLLSDSDFGPVCCLPRTH